MLTLKDLVGDFTLIKVPIMQIRAFIRYKYAERRYLSIVGETVDINDRNACNLYWSKVSELKFKYEKAKEEFDSIVRNIKP